MRTAKGGVEIRSRELIEFPEICCRCGKPTKGSLTLCAARRESVPVSFLLSFIPVIGIFFSLVQGEILREAMKVPFCLKCRVPLILAVFGIVAWYVAAPFVLMTGWESFFDHFAADNAVVIAVAGIFIYLLSPLFLYALFRRFFRPVWGNNDDKRFYTYDIRSGPYAALEWPD